jgi:anti-anti-sigma factor
MDPAPRIPSPDETGPAVDSALAGGVLRLTVTGELTETARRPLVRELTDRLLGEPGLLRVELALAGVGFISSAGIAVLVQLQKLGAPRGVEVVLVDPSPAVVRPLQLTGLWTRFPVVEERPAAEGGTGEG